MWGFEDPGLLLGGVFEMPLLGSVDETQCTLCQMLASSKEPGLQGDSGLRIRHQCAVHSALVFVIIDYLWRLFQERIG